MRKKIKAVLAISLSALMMTSTFSGLTINTFASQTELTKEAKADDKIDYEEIKSGMINTKEYNYLALNEMREEYEYAEGYEEVEAFYNSTTEGEEENDVEEEELPSSTT